MDQLRASNHGAELQDCRISNQAANTDGSQTVITGMDAGLYKAAAERKMDDLKKISEHEFQVQLTPSHNTILHIAAQFGKLDCVQWILTLPSCSSLLQRPNLKGETPLHLAAREGHLEVVEALIRTEKSLPVDIEAGIGAEKVILRTKNKRKDTALHEAVRYGHSNVAKLLIEEDPEFTYGPNSSGRTPLYIAAERRFADMVDMIISTCHSPAFGEITEKILEWKPALTKEVDDNGRSPLHLAAKSGDDPTIVSLLLKKSDNCVVYLGTKDGKKTALHIASLHHHGKIVEELLSQFPDCSEQVDDEGHNICHFAMMEKGECSTYLLNHWLRLRGLVNEEDAQGNTPLHLLSSSSNKISNSMFILDPIVDKKACNNECLTAVDIISRAQDISAGEKEVLLMIFRTAMNDPSTAEGLFKQINKVTQSRALKEKYISELKHRGEAHLIVSAVITTITFAAGFTLPGGYNGDDGMAILTRKTAFRAFVVIDTIALVLSVSVVVLHFFMTLHNNETILRKHFFWAFSFTILGMGAMVIAFTTGLYVVLPHSSALAIFTCILCSCFFLPFFLEFKLLGKNKNQ
ncbi:hypothetical protein PVL29_006496 [Vitis rotundifolia]|uniref:PGG domain-containing protein n=1 Tax=Vitis rotundifolia TaxID=103349 RepID=A0AA39A561_VITRO|nr:hypothetical protein PVL29_006496 [Vitis rotundifolia]